MGVEYGGGRRIVQKATVDLASTATLTTDSSITVTVTGAAIGDAVLIAPLAEPTTGTFLWGWVSAADSVTVNHSNFSAGTVNPASQSVIIYVFKKDSF